MSAGREGAAMSTLSRAWAWIADRIERGLAHLLMVGP